MGGERRGEKGLGLGLGDVVLRERGVGGMLFGMNE